MSFKEATDLLFQRVNHGRLAESLGISVAAIRQARLSESARAYRSAPKDWRRAVIRLAEMQVWHYRKLIESLQTDKVEND